MTKGFVMNDIDSILSKLLIYYDVDTLSELAEILDVTQPTISKWKARKAIIPIKNKCKELGIYEEIFNDLEFSEFDKIKILKQQCKKYDISTNFFIYDIKKTLNIIETMIKNNKKIEDKFHQYLKDFIKDNL